MSDSALINQILKQANSEEKTKVDLLLATPGESGATPMMSPAHISGKRELKYGSDTEEDHENRQRLHKADTAYHYRCFQRYLNQCGILTETKPRTRLTMDDTLNPEIANAPSHETYLSASESEFEDDNIYSFESEETFDMMNIGAVAMGSNIESSVDSPIQFGGMLVNNGTEMTGENDEETDGHQEVDQNIEEQEEESDDQIDDYDNLASIFTILSNNGEDPDHFYWEHEISNKSQGIERDSYGQLYDFKLDPIYRIQENSDFKLETIYLNQHKLYQNAIIGGSDFDANEASGETISKLPQNANETFYKFENFSKGLNSDDEHTSNNDTYDHKGSPIKTNSEFFDLDSDLCTIKQSDQPAEKLKGAINLGPRTETELYLGSARLYKNNLLATSQVFGYLIYAVHETIHVLPIEPSNSESRKGYVDQVPLCNIDFTSSITTFARRASASDRFPTHGINYIKVGSLLGDEVLGIAFDDGRVVLYRMRDLHDMISNSQRSNRPPPYSYFLSERMTLLELRLTNSVWGLDFHDDIIVASDNSHRVSLFHIDRDKPSKYYKIISRELMHNIPSVSILKDDDPGSEEEKYVSATTILGEIVIIKFKLKKVSDVNGYTKRPSIESRYLINEAGWTSEFISLGNFKNVSNFKELTGNSFIDQQSLIPKKILNNSKALDIESDPCYSSHMGFAAYLQEFKIKTSNVLQGDNGDKFTSRTMDNKSAQSTTKKYRRLKKFYDDYYLAKQKDKKKSYKSLNGNLYWEPIPTVKFKDHMLFVTSASKLHLFRPNRLILNASTPLQVFDFLSFTGLRADVHGDAYHLNRMSLSIHIPQLNCMVIASQMGLITIIRLTKHRGCAAFRQEFTLPDTPGQHYSSYGYDASVSAVTGLSYYQNTNGKVLLFITRVNAKLCTYELSSDLNKKVELLTSYKGIF